MPMPMHCTIPKRCRSKANKILRHCEHMFVPLRPDTTTHVIANTMPCLAIHTTSKYYTSCLHCCPPNTPYHAFTTAGFHSSPSPRRVCQSLSSLSAELRVGGRVLRVREKSSTSDLSPASTYLRRHHPICTAVDVSLPSGSICRPLTNTTRTLLAPIPHLSTQPATH